MSSRLIVFSHFNLIQYVEMNRKQKSDVDRHTFVYAVFSILNPRGCRFHMDEAFVPHLTTLISCANLKFSIK